jgi:hypothetical protein
MIKFRKFRWMQEGQRTVALSVKLINANRKLEVLGLDLSGNPTNQMGVDYENATVLWNSF